VGWEFLSSNYWMKRKPIAVSSGKEYNFQRYSLTFIDYPHGVDALIREPNNV
jgi:hypothetical protein